MIRNRMRSMGRVLDGMRDFLTENKGKRVVIVFAPIEDINYFTDHSEGAGVPCLVNRSLPGELRDLSDVLRYVQDPANRTTAVFRYMPMSGEYLDTIRQIDSNEETAYTVIGPIHEEE